MHALKKGITVTMGMTTDLTLIIICGDDPHVFTAIDSVDMDIPIVVSLVPSTSVESGLHDRGTAIVHSVKGNYATSVNRGLAEIETSRAFIIDSDCTLAPGCLEEVNRMLDKAPIARARVHFEYDSRLRWSYLISQMRDTWNNRSPAPAYTPGLGLHQAICSYVGGYFFDERVSWACDSEFSRRVNQAGLEVAYSPTAIVYHEPITLTHELGSAFKFGIGNRAQVKHGLRPNYEHPRWLYKRLLGWLLGRYANRQQHLRSFTFKTLTTGWWVFFYLGYYWAWGTEVLSYAKRKE